MKARAFNDRKRLFRTAAFLCAIGAIFLLAPGCSGGDSEETDTAASDTVQTENCSFGDSTFNPGESLTNSTDSCQTCDSTECFCKSDGSWMASGSACGACDASVIEECTEACEFGYQQDDSGCDICACNEAPETCEEGATQDVGDGCNTCTCDANGAWVCTQETCAPVCENGETKTLEDGCTNCACVNGQWKCDGGACTSCNPGEVKPPPDDCCTCSAEGVWDCSENPCPQTCEEGDTKEKGDGCNTCTCDGNNQWNCTEETCGEGSDCPPPAEHDCETKTFYGKNLVTGTCCEYSSPCAIPTTLEKYKEYEDCINGPWDGWMPDAEPSQAVDEGLPPDSEPPPEGDQGGI